MRTTPGLILRAVHDSTTGANHNVTMEIAVLVNANIKVKRFVCINFIKSAGSDEKTPLKCKNTGRHDLITKPIRTKLLNQLMIYLSMILMGLFKVILQ